jgi:hypothetical protein
VLLGVVQRAEKGKALNVIVMEMGKQLNDWSAICEVSPTGCAYACPRINHDDNIFPLNTDTTGISPEALR